MDERTRRQLYLRAAEGDEGAALDVLRDIVRRIDMGRENLASERESSADVIDGALARHDRAHAVAFRHCLWILEEWPKARGSSMATADEHVAAFVRGFVGSPWRWALRPDTAPDDDLAAVAFQGVSTARFRRALEWSKKPHQTPHTRAKPPGPAGRDDWFTDDEWY